MKLKINVSIFLLLFLVILFFSDNNKFPSVLVVGEFHTGGNSNEFPFSDVLDYTPGFSIYNSLVPENWRLNNNDYLSLVRGTICSIPVVGALIDSVFSIFWGKIFPGEQYISKQEFDDRMDKLANDMKAYTNSFVNSEIERLVVRTCHVEFGNLRQCSQNYKNLIEIWNNQINTTGVANSQLKDNLPVIFWVFLTKIEDSLRQFSVREYIHKFGKVYLETTFYYLSLLRDGHFNGISMGLSEELVNGLPNKRIETFSNKLNDSSFEALNNIGIIFINLFGEQDAMCHKKKKTECSYEIFKLPNWSFVVSSILYSNIVNYNGKILFLKGKDVANDRQLLQSNLTVEINVTNSVSVIDFRIMGKNINDGLIYKNPYERYSQVCDFVTGMVGYHYSKGDFFDHSNSRILRTKLGVHEPYFLTLKKNAHNIGLTEFYEDPITSYFFTNIVLNQFTNKNIKFRIYYSLPVDWLPHFDNARGYQIFQLRIGHLIPGQVDLTYDPFVLNDKQGFKSFSFFEVYPNESNNTGLKFKKITNHNIEITARYYLETPSFNFENSIYAYFEFRPIYHFSMNLLSLEVITSTT